MRLSRPEHLGVSGAELQSGISDLAGRQAGGDHRGSKIKVRQKEIT